MSVLKTVSIYPHIYNENCRGWCAIPSFKLLNELHQSPFNTTRWIVCIQKGTTEIRVALGDPVKGSLTKELYIPDWLFKGSGIDAGGELEVRFEPCERYSKPTRLVFSLLEEHENHGDLRDLIEEPLSQLGVLKVGQILPIPVLEGHMVVSEVDSKDPFNTWFFLDGNEIALEFRGEVKKVIKQPLVKKESFESQINFDSMLPDSILQKSYAIAREFHRR